MNRYSQYSTSQFNPLSLEEIMAIPIFKQQQHDAFLQGAEKLNALDFNRLQADNAQAEKELQAYRDDVNSYVDELYKTGVNRNLTNKLQQLKRTYDKNMSTSGNWGKMVGNYKIAKKYWDEISKDKNLSMDEAQRLYAMQLGRFKGTINEDGTSNQFQTKYAPTDVDFSKKINDIYKTLQPDQYGIAPHLAKKLDTFTSLWESNEVTELTKGKILNSMVQQMLGDPEVRDRMLFENELNGSPFTKEQLFTPVSMDEKGNIVADTPLGLQIKGIAEGGSFKNVKNNYFKDNDEYGLEQLKDQMARAREKDANGMQLISGEGRYNILASFNGVADVQNKINSLKKAGDEESLKTAHQYEEALFQATQEFNKNNSEYNNIIEIKKRLLAEGFTEQQIQEGIDNLNIKNKPTMLGKNASIIGTNFPSWLIQKFDKHNKDFKAIKEYNNKLNNYLKDYQIDTSNIYLGMGKNSEQYTKYGSEMLTRALNMNDITIDNVVDVGADGKQKMLKLNDKDRTNIINQIGGGDINIVSFNDMQGQSKNKLIVQIKGKDGAYKRVSLNMQDLYDKNTGLMTASGNLLYNLGKMSDTQGQQTINKFIQNQQYSNVVVGHENDNKKDFYNDPFLKDIISQKLPSSITKQYDVNLQQDSSGNYKIQMKNKLWDTDKDPKRTSKDKGTVRNMTWEDMFASNIDLTKITKAIQSQIIKDLYPTLSKDEALIKLINDPSYDTKYEEYLNKPVQGRDKNTLLNLFD